MTNDKHTKNIESQKKYRKPELKILGDLKVMTLGGGGSSSDIGLPKPTSGGPG